MFRKKINTHVDIHELIAARWSGRAYDSDKPVPAEHVLSIIEAARWAPSCFGDQPWRFIICNKADNKPAWDKIIACLSAGNKTWATHAPLLLLAVANTVMSKTGHSNRWGEYDTGAATENLCLQATALGLMAHQMGGFDAEQVQSAFNIPATFTPMAAISVGYQLAEDQITGDLREREYQERQRNELGENFFNGSWDTPMEMTC